MTPSRIPPPSRDGIPRPVPSPEAPPPVEIEVTEFEEVPTRLERRRCAGCAGPFVEIEGDLWIPLTYEEAWGGPYKGVCRGSVDPLGAWWCASPVEPMARAGDGRLVIPGRRMEVRFFPDRRLQDTPVVVDRRKGG